MDISTLKMLGGRLSLDFTNTADWHASDSPVELLTSYTDLVTWGERVDILAEDEANGLRNNAALRPDAAAAALERAISVREVLYRLFAQAARNNPPEAGDLQALNEELQKALAMSRLDVGDEGIRWAWSGGYDALDKVLWPVLRDAAELLTSDDISRVGQCADERCGWLFLDTSRNQRRRWCSMEDCGNRAKVRRHYRRSRAD
jgi:predicted RNA-binding Zn ribbon-like protein